MHLTWPDYQDFFFFLTIPGFYFPCFLACRGCAGDMLVYSPMPRRDGWITGGGGFRGGQDRQGKMACTGRFEGDALTDGRKEN